MAPEGALIAAGAAGTFLGVMCIGFVLSLFFHGWVLALAMITLTLVMSRFGFLVWQLHVGRDDHGRHSEGPH